MGNPVNVDNDYVHSDRSVCWFPTDPHYQGTTLQDCFLNVYLRRYSYYSCTKRTELSNLSNVTEIFFFEVKEWIPHTKLHPFQHIHVVLQRSLNFKNKQLLFHNDAIKTGNKFMIILTTTVAHTVHLLMRENV